MDRNQLTEIFSGEGITLEETVGQGGSGCVYRITYREQPTDQQVLKIMDLAESAKEFVAAGYSEELARERLLNLYERELELNKRITATRSEYLVRILQPYQFGNERSGACVCAIRMPYYETLRSLRRNGPLDEKTAVQMGVHLCEALRVLHHDARKEYYWDEDSRLGVMIHMDIKPDNIFYLDQQESRTFMLGDFGGLVDKERGRALTMTPGYFPPEAEQDLLTEAADLFSLGVTLYYCLCEGDNADAAVEAFGAARRNGTMVGKPAACSSQLWSVIETATRPAVEDRYQTAMQMRDALLEVTEKQKTQLQQKNTAMAIALAAGLACSFVGKILDRSTKVGRLEIDGNRVYFDGTLKHDRPGGKGVYVYHYGEEERTISGNFKWVNREKIKCGREKGFYTGMKCGGHLSGWGILEFSGCTYVGTLERDALRDGAMQYANGSVYQGQWKNDLPHGTGSLTDPEGKTLRAEWENGSLARILE